MNKEEAKELFFEYDGHMFHIWHDNPQMYRELDNMDIDDSIFNQWRQEILEKMFANILPCDKDIWKRHAALISVLNETKSNGSKNADRLIMTMNEFPNKLSKVNAIIITETMAGRSAKHTDSGVRFICENSNLIDELDCIINDINNFSCTNKDNRNEDGWKDMKKRKSQALKAYSEARVLFVKKE